MRSIPDWRNRLSLPVIAAPMFLVSGVELVVAQCRAGIVGSFPALNARPAEALDDWIRRIKAGLDENSAPFAVNLIVNDSNARLKQDLATCVRHEVPLVITSLMPPGEVVEAVHGYGGLVFHDVTTLRHAKKAAGQGVDGLILVCAGAGGHAGRLSPFAFVQEVRRFFDGRIVLAGAITSGEHVLATEALGADFAYMGSRFIATKESLASAGYKRMIVESAAADITYTDVVSGIHGNYLRPSLAAAGIETAAVEAAGVVPATSGARYLASEARPRAWRDIWGAGQGVGGIDDIPAVAECVARLRGEYDAARARIVTASGSVKV